MTSVLDHGHLKLVDVLGNDKSIVDAARVSISGEGVKPTLEDRNLIRYLLRNKHTTPFEMVSFKFDCKMPLFVARQWIRHRTACLAGDVELVFERPVDGKAYRLSVQNVFNKFQPTKNTNRPDKQGNPFHSRDRVQSMRMRCLNEDTGEIQKTNIVDIWESGVKPVFLVSINTSHGHRSIKTSEDHLFFTPDGWKKLKDLREGHMVMSISSRSGVPEATFNQVDTNDEDWAPVVGWEDYYAISTQGRVRRIVGGRGATTYGRCKKITASGGSAVASLNRPGEQVIIQIPRELLRSFVGEPAEGQEACHKNGNSLHNTLDNLRWGSSYDNSRDMVKHKHATYLHGQAQEILSIESAGEEMTYDLEVDGPWHNFSANDFVVHNSVNEMSARYSILPNEFYIPDLERIQAQSKNNKQGSGGLLSESERLLIREIFQQQSEQGYAVYEKLNDMGLARELSRMVLPTNIYTQWFWKMDLHNLMHFLKLRLHPHAQYEIRVFAEAISDVVKEYCPIAWEAFEDYAKNSVNFSAQELDLLKTIISGVPINNLSQVEVETLSKREFSEFVSKIGI